MSASKKKVPPVELLDPPQIAETIHQYFQSQPDLGDRLWSLVTDSGSLQRVWDAYSKYGKPEYSKYGKPEQFWLIRWWWIPGDPLDKADTDAFREMDRNPRHLMHLCRNSRMLSLACELFAKLAQIDPPAAEFAEALLQHASDMMGEAMDSKRPASEFWSRDGWWLSQGWQEAALLLAGKRDPLRVAGWVALTDPPAALRCLQTLFQDVSTPPPELAESAFQRLTEIFETKENFKWTDNPIPQLIAIVAQAANPEHPEHIKHLSYILDRLVPEVFHPAVHEWREIFGDDGLSTLFRSLVYSRPGLQQAAERLAELQPGQRKKRLIVHIDDDAAILDLSRLIIDRMLGGEVLVASVSEGAGGLILASCLLPDLIMTDVMEPVIDGFTFARYLKDNPLTGDIPFVFVTAVHRIEFGLNLGAKDYITKPYSPQDLVARIQKVLGLEPDR